MSIIFIAGPWWRNTMESKSNKKSQLLNNPFPGDDCNCRNLWTAGWRWGNKQAVIYESEMFYRCL